MLVNCQNVPKKEIFQINKNNKINLHTLLQETTFPNVSDLEISKITQFQPVSIGN